MKTKILLAALLLTPFAALGQANPPPVSAFTYSAGSWMAAATTATAGQISYQPPAAALYCYNSSTGKWVPADSSCFGGGGSTLSLTSPTSTLTLSPSPITGTGTLDLNLAHANTWTGQQTFVAPVLGTPASGVLTNATGLPAASVVVGALANGMTATTQTTGDNTTKVATDAFVLANGGSYLPLAGGTMTGAITLPNGSAASPSVVLGSAGGFYAVGGVVPGVEYNGAAAVDWFGNNSRIYANVQIGSTFSYQWTQGAVNATAVDTALSRYNPGLVAVNGGFVSLGTKFTTSGCSVSATTGGASAGKMTLGANTCSVVITFNGATGLNAPNGWSCSRNDETTAAGNTGLYQSASSTTSATITIPATAGTTDVIDFACMAY